MLQLVAVALVAAALLMTELALTRIFSVVMYYHFAFLAISIALFGLSASGVYAYLRRAAFDRRSIDSLLSSHSLVYTASTLAALFALVRLRVGLNYSPQNLALMLAIYALAAVPFFTGGLVITLAISRLPRPINAVYAADLLGAALGTVLLIPLLNGLGAPGVVLTAAGLAAASAVLFASPVRRWRTAAIGMVLIGLPLAGQLSHLATFDVTDTKGHRGDRVLFSRWNSFSRVGVYEREHGDWSLSRAYQGALPATRFMDIDSAASTPIVHVRPDLSDAQYLRYELTALAYGLKERTRGRGFSALVIGPGGGRDLLSALVFGAARVDGVEINPIIADEIMRGRFHEFSGGIYTHPNVRIFVQDGRSFVRRTPSRYDVIQASLVDTWAATAAGAYTLTENTLYTVEAFDDYLDHLTNDGILTITRWVFDGLRLVSLARAAVEARGADAASRIAVVQHDRVATFLLKRSPFTAAEVNAIRENAARLQFRVLYAPDAGSAGNATSIDRRPRSPGPIDAARPSLQDEPPALDASPSAPSTEEPEPGGTAAGDYARLIRAPDSERFYREYPQDIRPTTDDRPFFFHTTKIEHQFATAFGRSMLFGNGLSALMTLMAISAGLVALFVIGPLVVAGGAPGEGWRPWLVYFGSLGAGFMLLEVVILQRFVLLLGHPVYSLTVTLFSLLLGTALGAAWSRRLAGPAVRRAAMMALAVITVAGVALSFTLAPVIDWGIPLTRTARIALSVALLVPLGVILGIPMPSGLRLLRDQRAELVAWAWGLNGALSVVGATAAIFVAMNWGFAATLRLSAVVYATGLLALLATPGPRPPVPS
jgi:spermidine synthase